MGSRGLIPTLAAIREGKTIGLANKETLVMGGAIVMEEAKKAGVAILPIDSEHSAIYQCLHKENPTQVKLNYINGLRWTFSGLAQGKNRACNPGGSPQSPNWSMGEKIGLWISPV